MRSVQTTLAFPLSSVKPLDRLLAYRSSCLEATRRALAGTPTSRRTSPLNDAPLLPAGSVGGLAYGRCPQGGGMFLMEVPTPEVWAQLLGEVNHYRHSPQAFHQEVAESRQEHVYLPKLEWIESALRFQDVHRPRLIEVTTFPSDFTPLLKASGTFSEVIPVDEMTLLRSGTGDEAIVGDRPIQAAVLLESLDRVSDPGKLLAAVSACLVKGGLIFVTGLVWSGFDFSVLGFQNQYLYPPDRTNCFTIAGLAQLLKRCGFLPLEISTPGVLDLEIVQAHLRHNPELPLSGFDRQLLVSRAETQTAFQVFLQQEGLSSFARLVGRKLS